MRILRNILSILLGAIVGSIVNMAIIQYGMYLFPLPEGINPNDMVSLKEGMHLFQPINFLTPFLAHAVGTFVGAILAGYIAASHKMIFAMFIGFLFLVGGIMMVLELPAPIWFNAFDLIVAYLPMAYVGGLISLKIPAVTKMN